MKQVYVRTPYRIGENDNLNCRLAGRIKTHERHQNFPLGLANAGLQAG